MKALPLLALVLTAAGSGCISTPRQVTTIDEVRELEQAPKLAASQVQISVKVRDAKGSVTQAPSLITKVGQEATVKISRVFIYPVAFDLPAAQARKPAGTAEENQAFPVTPATPTKLSMRETGVSLTLTPRLRGPFIEVTGTFTRTEIAGLGLAAGEPFSPITDSSGKILLTENRAQLPEFEIKEAPVYFVGLPGVEHTSTYPNFSLSITCEAIK